MKHQLDTVHLRRRLQKTQHSYDAHAIVQKEITSRALERLHYIQHKPQRILDLSWHVSDSEAIIRKLFPKASYIATASVLQTLQARKQGLFRKPKSVCMALSTLPFVENSVDFIFMSLSLLWVEHWPSLLRECYRVLRSSGMLLFTTLGPDTLKELRHAFASVDTYQHVHGFVDMHDIGDALVKIGFENPVMDLEHVEMHYQSLSQLMADLKKTGSNNISSARRKSLMTPRQRVVLEKQYKKLGSNELCATFEFVYGHAWVGERKRQWIDQKTQEVIVPLSKLR